MTDTNQESIADQSLSTPVAEVSNVSYEAPKQEKMVPQSHVDKIVQDAWHRGRQKALAEHVPQQQQQYQAPQHTDSDLDARLDAKLQQKLSDIQKQEQAKLQDEMSQKLANEFLTKVNSGKEKYQDFDQKVGDMGYGSIAHIVGGINTFDNAADIVYELANHPEKLGQINALLGTPHLAMAALQRLSQSVKRNEEAKGQRYPDEPLSPLSHSNTGKDSGSNSINDLKRADWLRG